MKSNENYPSYPLKKGVLGGIALIIFTSVLVFTGCKKNTTVYIPLKGPEVSKPVSFSKDLVPIFVANCAKSGCHASGGKAPDLSADKAYASITADPDYVNKAVPENSEIYLFLTGKRSPSMPIGAAANPSNIEGLFLAWVKQGAKKN